MTDIEESYSMNLIPYQGDGLVNSEFRFMQGFSRLSIFSMNGRTPNHVTLWSSDTSGINVYSEMHTVAEWREIGALNFRQVKQPEAGEKFFELPKVFRGELKAQKMVIEKYNHRVESGIRFEAKNGDSIVIVANSFPCGIAVSVSGIDFDFFEPEYPIEEYNLEDF